jgi:hypothetical protein
MFVLSCKQIGGHAAGSEPVPVNGIVQWTLANDGTVAWPQGTTLRLVGGPVMAAPVMEVPAAEPGQTLEVELEVVDLPSSSSEAPPVFEAFYCLVTPCGQPFGEILKMQAAIQQPGAFASPICLVAASPCDSCDTAIEGLQGELKTVEWTLANVGLVNWPDDAYCQLFYNTPGFAHLPGTIEIPNGVAPGMTVQVGITALMPEKEGQFKAMWAVVSPSTPDFGDILVVEFHVDEFPFMDWVLAEDASLKGQSDEDTHVDVADYEVSESPRLSAAHVMHVHHMHAGGDITYDDAADEKLKSLGFLSLGCASGLAPGSWLLEVVLSNDGNVPWPADSKLSCCYGDGMGCHEVPLGSLQAGESCVVQMELDAQPTPRRSGWVLTSGEACFGPVLLLDTV